MRVFRTRAQGGRRTEVATNGTRIITPDNRHGHRRDATVVTVPATHVSSRHGHRRDATVVTVPPTHGSSHHGHGGNTTVVATNVSRGHGHRARGDGQRRYYSDDPSTIHGLWNKFLGAITGNDRRRRHGEREMRKAHDKREALRIARGVQRVREGGHMTKLRKFRERHSRHHHRDDPIIISQDTGRSRRQTPWLHHKHRTLPPYHGAHHSFMGFFTRHRERRALGRAMAAAAEDERRRERRRRKEELRDMGRRYRERRRY